MTDSDDSALRGSFVMLTSAANRRLTTSDAYALLANVEIMINVRFTLEDFSYSSTASAYSALTARFTANWNAGVFMATLRANIQKRSPSSVSKFSTAGTVGNKFGSPRQFLTVPEPTARPTPTPSPTRAPTTGTLPS
jgi:hypothetical protein